MAAPFLHARPRRHLLGLSILLVVTLFMVIACGGGGGGGGGGTSLTTATSATTATTSTTSTNGLSVTLSASPATIDIGQPTTLSWSSAGGVNDVAIYQGSTPTGTPIYTSTSPNGSTTFTPTPQTAGAQQFAIFVRDSSGDESSSLAAVNVNFQAPYMVNSSMADPGEQSVALSDDGYAVLGFNESSSEALNLNPSPPSSPVSLANSMWHPQIASSGSGNLYISGGNFGLNSTGNYNMWALTLSEPNLIQTLTTNIDNDENDYDWPSEPTNQGNVLFYSSGNPGAPEIWQGPGSVIGTGTDMAPTVAINSQNYVVGASRGTSGTIDVYTPGVTGVQKFPNLPQPIDLANNGDFIAQSAGSTTLNMYNVLNGLEAPPGVAPLSNFTVQSLFGFVPPYGLVRCISNSSDERVVGQISSTGAWAVFDVTLAENIAKSGGNSSSAVLPISLPSGYTVVALGPINAQNWIAAKLSKNGETVLALIKPSTTFSLDARRANRSAGTAHASGKPVMPKKS